MKRKNMIYFFIFFIFLINLSFSDEKGIFLENPKENLEKISDESEKNIDIKDVKNIRKDNLEKFEKTNFWKKEDKNINERSESKKSENKKNEIPQKDKKIGLALSGGTAKGLAHIGILKVLDEEKVPVEFVTGTSMGSIIAGMYSVGYTPKEIEEIAENMDWMKLFNDKIERRNKGITRNMIEDQNSIVLPLGKKAMPKLPVGVVGGKTASQQLNELFYGAIGTDDFTKFPRKFAAVATDLNSGEGVMITKGSIATAIRASLSLPSIFAPVRSGDRLYIDGGVVRNLPVQDLKVLGADYTIGVNVGDGFVKRDENKMNLIDVITDSSTIAGRQEVERQIRMLDLYMKPDLEKFEAYDFSKVKEIIAAGEKIARDNIDKIRELSNPKLYDELEEKRKEFRKTWTDEYNITSIDIEGNKKYKDSYFKKFLPKKLGNMNRLEMEEIVNEIYQNGNFTTAYYEVKNNKLVINVQEKPSDYVTLNGNINNEDKATINFGFQGNKVLGDINARYSSNTTVSNEYGINNSVILGIGKDEKVLILGNLDYKRDMIYNQNFGNGYYDFVNKKFSLETGVGFQISKNLLLFAGGGYQTSKVEKNQDQRKNGKKRFPFFETSLTYDTRNSIESPTKGIYFTSKYTFSNSKDANFNALYQTGEVNIPVGEKLTFTPKVSYLTVKGSDIPETYEPKLGGIKTEDNSLEFFGLPADKVRGESIFVGSVKLQYNISKILYADTMYSRAYISDEGFDFGSRKRESYKFGFGVKTPLGPGYFGIAKVPGETLRYILNFGYKPQ